MFELRSYQQECLDKIEETFIDKNRLLIQLPTGSGKTVIFWSYIKKNNVNSLIIVPSLQLMYQVREMGWKFGLKDQISCKGGKLNQKHKKFHITTIASLPKSKEKFKNYPKFDLIVCDEAHRSLSPTYKKLFSFYEDYPDTKIIGLTATPERMDAQSILSIFENFVYSKEIYDLIEEGHLCDLKAYRIKTNININRASFYKGDFTTASLLRYLDNDTRNNQILQAYKNRCLDRKTLIFCICISHSKKMADFFNSQNISCEHIDGSMSYQLRNEILKRFNDGKTKVITNCQLLTEGFDQPSIDAIIIARPTRSKGLYTQMIGRGVRLFPGKEDCIILELSDNCHKICDFKVLAGNKDLYIPEFEDGVSILKMVKLIPIIEATLSEGHEEKFNLFYDLNNILNKKPLASQLSYLKRFNIYFDHEIKFHEAAFLRWKHLYKKSKEENGINKRKK